MRKFIARLKSRIALNPKAFKFYSVLRILVIVTAVRCVFMGNYEGLGLCILSLILFLLPSLFEAALKVEIPAVFQIIIYSFIFAAEILGEINKFYTTIPGWDTMLHTLNGFLCAAIGISLAGILNKGSNRISLSPFYVALMGFCFSMTIGVLWEFFEFTMDQLFFLDMQKDFIVKNIGSVTLDATNSQIPVKVSNIVKTTIMTADGSIVEVNGYLDIGIKDTMKDLIVNFVGAVVFSISGYFYEKNTAKKSLAEKLIIKPLSEDELKEQEQFIEDRMKEQEEKHKEQQEKLKSQQEKLTKKIVK